MSKGFCECKSPDFIARPLPGIPGPIFVHTCGFPFRAVYDGYLKRCDTCLRLFSNPFGEKNCSKCFKELVKFDEIEDRIYNSWTWASKLVYDFMQNELAFDPSLCARLSLSMTPPVGQAADLPAGGHAQTSSEPCQSESTVDELSFSF